MNLKHILPLAALAASSLNASAQQLQSAYFLDGYIYGHELNPAKDYDRRSYFALPFFGGMNIGVNGNLNLQDIVRQHPNGSGDLVTYLHPAIGVDDALSKFHDNNKLIQSFQMNVLSFGFHAFHGFNTFGVKLREEAGINVPYGLFDLTKNLQNKDYNISSFGASSQVFAEVALGHSREVWRGVRVGAKAKVLLGLANVEASMDNLSLNLQQPDRWTATANATIDANIKGLTVGHKMAEYSDGTLYETVDFDDADIDSPGLAGTGFAVDLGAEADLGKIVEPLKGLKVSVAVNDLGFINWKEGVRLANQGEPFEFKGFNDVKVDDVHGTDIEDQTDDLSDRLERLYSLKEVTDGKGHKRNIGSTFRLAAEYALPQYDRLSFGLLYNHRFQGQYSWDEARLSATISPLKAIEVSANVGVGTFGTSLGWVLNVHPNGFNIFVGMDHVLGKLSKQMIPLRSNADITFGIAFPMGKSRI